MVNATGAVQKNNTPVDPKPRTHTKQATTPIPKCSQPSHSRTRNAQTLTAQCCQPPSLPNFPVPLCPPSRLCPLFLPRLEYPPQRLPTLFLLNSSALLLSHCDLLAFPSWQKTISILDSSCLFLFFLLSSLYLQWLSPRVFHALSSSRLFFSLSLGFLFLPLASPSFFFPNIADALAVAPALCAPARVARAMASDFHANHNFAAGVVSGALTACGSTPLAVWGALPKRRGNAGSDSELPYHLNTFLEVRWVCVFASTLSHPPLALTALSLSAQLIRLSLHTHARAFPALSPISRSLPFFLFGLFFVSPSPPLCLIFFLFVLPSSSSSPHPLLLLLGVSFLLVVFFFSFVSALANPCWLKPLWLPAQLLGGVNVGSRILVFERGVELRSPASL